MKHENKKHNCRYKSIYINNYSKYQCIKLSSQNIKIVRLIECTRHKCILSTRDSFFCLFVLLLVVLGNELRASLIVDKSCATELHPQPTGDTLLTQRDFERERMRKNYTVQTETIRKLGGYINIGQIKQSEKPTKVLLEIKLNMMIRGSINQMCSRMHLIAELQNTWNKNWKNWGEK